MKLQIVLAFGAIGAILVAVGDCKNLETISDRNLTSGRENILDAGDDLALQQINLIRSTHQATSPLTYSTSLARDAVNCADSFASLGVEFKLGAYAFHCANTAYGAIMGFSPAPSQLDAIRYVITDATAGLLEPFGWVSGYNAIVDAHGVDPFRNIQFRDDDSVPESETAPRHIRARGYVQMIWAAATQVGCGHSITRVNYRDGAGVASEVRIVVCLFNVKADFSGNTANQLNNIKPKK